MISLATFNIRGLGHHDDGSIFSKREQLGTDMCRYHVDICALQETKVTDPLDGYRTVDTTAEDATAVDNRAEDGTAEDATAELFNLGWTLRRSHQILTNYYGRYRPTAKP